jgi:DinB superfamily
LCTVNQPNTLIAIQFHRDFKQGNRGIEMTESIYMAAMQHDDPTQTSADLIVAYEAGIHELSASVAGMTPEQVRTRPIPGKWSTQEVVSHLADTEIYFSDRIERTIVLERPLLMDVDEQPYIKHLGYQDFDLTEELNLFIALRRHIVRILKRQPPEAWQRTAIHTGTGLVTLRKLVLQAVRHTRHHLPFIAEKRAAMSKGGPA